MFFENVDFSAIELPPAALKLCEEVRAFLSDEAAAGAFTPHLGHSEFDAEFTRRIAARGWIGMTWPKRYGGRERSFLERYVVTEECRVANAPVGQHFTAAVPGERLNRAVVDYLRTGTAAGMLVPDSADPELARVRVQQGY